MKSRILSLASDTLVYGFFVLVGRFLTFLLTPFYTNYLTIEEVGDLGNIFSLIAFTNVVFSFGMDAAFMRFYSKNNEIQTKKAFTIAYLTIFFISFAFTLLLYLLKDNYYQYLTALPNGRSIVALAILVPFTDTLMVLPYAYLRMTRQVFKFSTIRFSLIVIAVFFNILFVVLWKLGIVGVFYAQLIANLVGLAIFLPIISKQLLLRIDLDLFKNMLRFGIPTIPATFSGIVLQVVDRPILKYLTNSQEVGIYMVNYRLAIPMMLFVAMYDYAWRPFYLTNYESEDAKALFSRILTYFALCSAIMFLVVSFYMDYVVRLPFFGGKFIEPSYWVGMDIIPIVMMGYVFNGFYINFTAGINIMKKTNYLPISIGLGALVNVLFNFISIPHLGYRGAAWATFFAYLVTAVTAFYFLQKIYPMRYDFKRVFSIFVLLLIFFYPTYVFTKELPLDVRFLVRTIALLLFILAFFVFRFFNRKELDAIKQLIHLKKTS